MIFDSKFGSIWFLKDFHSLLPYDGSLILYKHLVGKADSRDVTHKRENNIFKKGGFPFFVSNSTAAEAIYQLFRENKNLKKLVVLIFSFNGMNHESVVQDHSSVCIFDHSKPDIRGNYVNIPFLFFLLIFVFPSSVSF